MKYQVMVGEQCYCNTNDFERAIKSYVHWSEQKSSFCVELRKLEVLAANETANNYLKELKELTNHSGLEPAE